MNISKLYKFVKALLKLATITTDKGNLIYDNELNVGTEVFVELENGDLAPAEDGEYITEDQIIVVENGIVKEIRAKEAEVPAEEPVETPVEEPVEEPMAEEPVEAPVEEPQPDEKDAKIAELEAKVAELEAENEALKAENAELKAKLEEPVAEPAEDELKKKEKCSKFEFKHRSVK